MHTKNTSVIRLFLFATTTTSSAMSPTPPILPERYGSRKSSMPHTARSTRALSRYRSKRNTTIKKSPADKKALADARKGRKLSYHDALDSASAVILLEARKLHDQFGQHDVDYYLEEIMQHSRLGKGKRNINLWNVFLRQQLALYNDGQFMGYNKSRG